MCVVCVQPKWTLASSFPRPPPESPQLSTLSGWSLLCRFFFVRLSVLVCGCGCVCVRACVHSQGANDGAGGVSQGAVGRKSRAAAERLRTLARRRRRHGRHGRHAGRCIKPYPPSHPTHLHPIPTRVSLRVRARVLSLSLPMSVMSRFDRLCVVCAVCALFARFIVLFRVRCVLRPVGAILQVIS